MSNIALCPNCGGQKTTSKPPYIAGDVNSWVDSGTPTYPCPTCNGNGWIRVGSVPQDDFDDIKRVALSSMETSENLMDECTKRGDKTKELEAQVCSLTEQRDRFARVNTRLMREADKQYDALCEHVAYTYWAESERDSTIRHLAKEHNNDIKELETDLARKVAGEHATDEEIKRLGDELDHSMKEKDVMFLNQMTWATCSDATNALIDDLLRERDRDKLDIKLLDKLLEIVTPLIGSGAYEKPSAESRLLAIRMHGVCQTVVQFRRKHDIVG